MIQGFTSIVGYGTFITKSYWKDKEDVETCLVKDYVRIFPEGNWFPYILSCKGASFWALKFNVSEKELDDLDQYEGVSANLFKRVETKVKLKNNEEIRAYLYVPTEETIESQNLSHEMDKIDRWKEEIKKIPDIVKEFPELIL